MDTREQERKNAMEMKGWNAWKSVCSIAGLEKEETADGYYALSESVVKQFRIFASAMGVRARLDAAEIIAEFDSAMWLKGTNWTGPAHPIADEPTHANFKDYLFYRANHDDKPPLAALRGMITGHGGYIRDIVRNYVGGHFGGRNARQDAAPTEGAAEGEAAPTGKKKRVYRHHSSLSQPAGDDDGDGGMALGDVLPPRRVPAPDSPLRRREGLKRLATWKRRDQLLFLAAYYHVHANDEELCRALGIAKSACAVAMGKMRHNLQTLMVEVGIDKTDSEFFNEAAGLIYREASAEISAASPEIQAQAFLSLLDRKLLMKGENDV